MLRRYERVCFDRAHARVAGRPRADLLAPAHPLLDATVEAIIERHGDLLRLGAILVDERDGGDQPRLLVALTQQIVDGQTPATTVSERFEFVELAADGSARSAGPAPYLDYRGLHDDEKVLVADLPGAAWLAGGAEELATAWAVEHGMPAHLSDVRERVGLLVARTRGQVKQRLVQEINYWYGESAALAAQRRTGDDAPARGAAAGSGAPRSPEAARRRAEELERRLGVRLAELDREEALVARPPLLAGTALVVPRGLLDRLAGVAGPAAAADTMLVARRAVAAVLAAEQALGRVALEMPHNNPGYDISSRPGGGGGARIDIEVKGRVVGAEDFFVTRTEVFHAKNVADAYRLALVAVDLERGPEHDEVRYLANPFTRTEFGDFEATGIDGKWPAMWAKGRQPW